MILSHKHRFIFIKTKHTASTSMEIALSSLCGPNDIITPIVEEVLRRKKGGRPPQNCYRPDAPQHGNKRASLSWWNHMPAHMVRRRIGQQAWDDYFKFCVLRNPWDRAISAYWWIKQSRDLPLPVSDCIENGLLRDNVLSDWERIAVDGRLAMDRVICFERLQHEVDILGRTLETGPIDLPCAKGNVREDRRPPCEVLTPVAAEIISYVCANEIDLMGYTFNSPE